MTGPLQADACTFITTFRSFLLRIGHFRTRVAEKIELHSLCSKTYSRKSCHLLENVEKYGTAGQATDDMIRRMRTIC
jgi:hypothetical protein